MRSPAKGANYAAEENIDKAIEMINNLEDVDDVSQLCGLLLM